MNEVGKEVKQRKIEIENKGLEERGEKRGVGKNEIEEKKRVHG